MKTLQQQRHRKHFLFHRTSGESGVGTNLPFLDHALTATDIASQLVVKMKKLTTSQRVLEDQNNKSLRYNGMVTMIQRTLSVCTKEGNGLLS